MTIESILTIICLIGTVVCYVGYRHGMENVKLTCKDQRVGGKAR